MTETEAMWDIILWASMYLSLMPIILVGDMIRQTSDSVKRKKQNGEWGNRDSFWKTFRRMYRCRDHLNTPQDLLEDMKKWDERA